MTSLLMKEIHNLQEVIDDCLEKDNSIVEDFKGKYDHAYGRMQKSMASEFYMGQCLAYKDILSIFGVKV